MQYKTVSDFSIQGPMPVRRPGNEGSALNPRKRQLWQKNLPLPDEMKSWHVRCFYICWLGGQPPKPYYLDKEPIMKPKRSLKQTVTGIIVPQMWDDNGKVIGLSIQAFDEREYIVKAYKRGKELFEFINENVKVTGKLQERLDGKVLIEVNQFEILESRNVV
jgi:hypothetical protein